MPRQTAPNRGQRASQKSIPNGSLVSTGGTGHSLAVANVTDAVWEPPLRIHDCFRELKHPGTLPKSVTRLKQ